MIDVEFVTNAVATLILAAMLLIPIVNLLVGAIVGGSIGGFAGFAAGCLVAGAITVAEIMLTRGPTTATSAEDDGRADDNEKGVVYLDAGRPRMPDPANSDDPAFEQRQAA